MNKTCVYYCEGEDDQKLIDVGRLWTTAAPGEFDFAERNSSMIKQ